MVPPQKKIWVHVYHSLFIPTFLPRGKMLSNLLKIISKIASIYGNSLLITIMIRFNNTCHLMHLPLWLEQK